MQLQQHQQPQQPQHHLCVSKARLSLSNDELDRKTSSNGSSARVKRIRRNAGDNGGVSQLRSIDETLGSRKEEAEGGSEWESSFSEDDLLSAPSPAGSAYSTGGTKDESMKMKVNCL